MYRKLLRNIFLLLLMCFSFCSQSTAQRKKGLSNSPLKISLVEAIEILGKHHHVIFEYNDKLLADKTVELSALNKYSTLEKTLDFLIKPFSFKFEKFNEQSYLIYDPTINIKKKIGVEIKKTTNSPAEGIIIKGKVKSEDGNETLQGVSILIKGFSKGTSTDKEGNFTLTVPKENAVLIISSIGYLKKEVAINDKRLIEVALKIDNSPLSEVVVVGYGIQKKQNLTGAIATIGAETFKDRAISNVALALQGSTSGLVITRSSSRPGNEGLKIRIRGESSITDVDPLIVIDGIPTLGTWELSQLNTDDIASISVLKDASAAIYGARSAGGVILITTKRGKEGKMKLIYHSNIRASTLGRTTPVSNMSQYAQLLLEASEQDGLGYYWIYDRERLEKMKRGETFLWNNPLTGYEQVYQDNNWMKALYGMAVSQQHNLSLSSSTDKSNYRISLAYANNKGLLKPAYDGEKKYNMRVNYDYALSEKVKIETGISYDKREVSFPIAGIGDGWYDPPIFPVYNSKGNWYDDFGFRNPIAKTAESGRVTTTDDIIRLNLKLSAKLWKNVTFSSQLSNVNLRGWRKQYYQTYKLYNWIGDRVTNIQNPDPTIQEDVYNTTYQNYGGFLDYKKTFAKHSFSAMVGITTELNDNKSLMGKRMRLLYPGLYDLNTADPVNATNAGGASHWGLFSYVSRLNYDYEGKYILELTGRRDGSSRFAKGFKWSTFGSVSVGWLISKEKFMEEIPFINELKIRGGYGETGGQSGIGLYDYLSTINTGTTIFGEPYTIQQTASLTGMTSTTRTWERISVKNIGFDFGIINNKLSGSFDYFLKRNSGMLVDVAYPELLGATAPKTNNGILAIKGWEFQVNWKDKIGEDVAYNLSFNISDNRNKLIAMEGKNAWNTGLVSQIQGYPLNAIFVYKTDGYFQTQEEVDAYYAKYTAINDGELPTVGTQKLRPGDLRKLDLDGNGYISAIGNANQNGSTGDLQYIGDNAPHFTYGFNIGFTWKGFDLTTFLQGVGSQNMLRWGYLNAPFRVMYVNQNPNFLGNTWTPDNTNAAFPRLSLVSQRNNWNYNNTDIMVQKLRYLRLKTFVLGYSLPNNLVKKIGLDKCRLYVSGNDLWEWTTIKDGFDPEFGENTNQTYPFARTWSMGLELHF